MRRLLLAFVLVLSACSLGGGVGPGDTVVTTSPPPSTTTTAPSDPDDATAAAQAATGFYEAVARTDFDAAAASSNGTASSIATAVGSWTGDISPEHISFVVGGARIEGAEATIGVAARIEGRSIGVWAYTMQTRLVRYGTGWVVDWTPSALHPDLTPGDRIEIHTEWPRRGSILAVDGSPLALDGPVKVIGVVPQWIDDLEMLTEVLEEEAAIPPATVQTELDRPGVQPDWFLPVGTIDASRTGAIDRLLATPGVVLRDGTGRITPEADLARHIVGTMAPISAEQLETWGDPYRRGDLVGRSGLEAALQRRLAGIPGIRLVRVNRYGREVGDLHTVAGEAGTDITTTLDIAAQRAVDNALDGIDGAAAVVLIDVASGGVRASANRPVDGIDRAFLGLYPPGSSFKVVTAAALVTDGLTSESVVECPSSVIVGGARFRNAGDRDLGSIELMTAFAESCNTTFASLAGTRLSGGELAAYARSLFGFDTGYDAGLPAATARFPDPADTAELAAQAIGQGRVLVTPLHQASVAAAVAGGGWLQPTLLEDEIRVRIPLAADVGAQLAAMMRRVVTDGTGTGADVSGFEVSGKTGSAEFDASGRTHAWFIGFWGDYAIAVVVEAGGSGGQVAAPIVAEIVAALGD